MIPLGFFQIFVIVKINNIWVYPHTLPILLNQGVISELKACTHKKNANPTFQRHFPLGMGSIFVPVTVLHSSNCHALLWNPQCTPLAGAFLDYCSLWSAFCVPLDMGQILTWGAESHTVWILLMSQRNLPFFYSPVPGPAPGRVFPISQTDKGKKTTWNTSKCWAAQNNSFNYYNEMSWGVPAWHCSFCARLFCDKTEEKKK